MKGYTSRVLIVDVPDNDWKSDSMPATFADLIGVKTKLHTLQFECNLDYVSILRTSIPGLINNCARWLGNWNLLWQL